MHTLKKTFSWAVVLLLAGTACAQLKVPETPRRAVANSSNVFDDRGAQIELLPQSRLAAATSADGSRSYAVTAAATGDVLDAQHLGLVFNHSLQATGAISGEITFQLRTGLLADTWSTAQYPGLKQIVKPNVYVVNARSMSEFAALLQTLQRDARVQWVEPTIQYGLVPSEVGNAAQ